MHGQNNFLDRQEYQNTESLIPKKTISKNNSLNLSISSKTIVRFLSIIGLCLLFASTIGQLYQHFINQDRYRRLIRLLYVDAEKNIPTAYSFLILIICSILLAIIAFLHEKNRTRYRKHWKGLSILFFILAMDEFCSIHELATHVTRNSLKTSGFFYFAWVIPGIAFLSIFILAYLRFIFSLPSNTRIGFIFSGSIFIFGAMGMELIGGYFFELYGSDNISYIMIATFEEMLEFFGIIVFIYSLLEYLKTHLQFCKILITD